MTVLSKETAEEILDAINEMDRFPWTQDCMPDNIKERLMAKATEYLNTLDDTKETESRK